MVYRQLNLLLTGLSVDMQHLARIDQVGIVDVVAISFVQQRPLVGITINLCLSRDSPQMIARLNNVTTDRCRSGTA